MSKEPARDAELATSDQLQDIERPFLVAGLTYDLSNPMTWRARIGQITIQLAKAVFDIAEKALVVVAFTAAAKLTSDRSVSEVSFALWLLWALYVTFQAEKVIAQGFAYMRWHGVAAFSIFTLLMLGFFGASAAIAVPWLGRVTDALVEAAK